MGELSVTIGNHIPGKLQLTTKAHNESSQKLDDPLGFQHMGQLSVNTGQKLDDLVHTSVNHFRSAGYSTTSLSLLKTPIGPLLTKMSS